MKLYEYKWDPQYLLAQYEQDRAKAVERHLQQQAANARELAQIDEEIEKIKAFIKEHT